MSEAGVFILLYELRKNGQELKIRRLFVYLERRGRMNSACELYHILTAFHSVQIH